MDKPNCYECKWRKDCMGSAHLQCINPTMNEKLREILEHVYSCDVRSDTLDKKDIIDQATSEIKSLIKGKLPKKIPIPEEPISASMGAKLLGYNQSLTEIEQIIEEI